MRRGVRVLGKEGGAVGLVGCRDEVCAAVVPHEGGGEGEVAFADEEDARVGGEGDYGLGLGGLVVLFGLLLVLGMMGGFEVFALFGIGAG